MKRELLEQRLREHLSEKPSLKARDILKFIHQSAFGCEHVLTDEASALEGILRESEDLGAVESQTVERLAGEYARVPLCVLKEGLKPETLARLLVLSATEEQDARSAAEELLAVAARLVREGVCPCSESAFLRQADAWRAAGYPALHHSEVYRAAYRPHYRVLSLRFVSLLPLLCAIDHRARDARFVLAVEGGSASGKTTLAATLCEVYGASVFHMDDFFLRPEQRTKERFSQIGGNVDYERVEEEVLRPLSRGEDVVFRPFDCRTMTLSGAVHVRPAPLVIVEGAYSMHPRLSGYYDLSVFLDVTKAVQKARIERRNTPALAERFFSEWIPLEDVYFTDTRAKERCEIVLCVPE